MANLLTNGTFTGSLANWSQSPAGIATYDDNTCILAGDPADSGQFLQHGFTIVDATEYTFSFKGRAAANGQKLRLQLVDHDDHGNNLGLDATYTLTTTDAIYSTTFTTTDGAADARIRFRFTVAPGSFVIDDVSIDTDSGGGALDVDFSATPLTGIAPLTVDFTDMTPGTVTTWLWEYNKDGAGWVTFDDTDDATPQYEFTDVGTYAIRLTAETATEEGTHTKDGYIAVAGGVVADFSGTPLTGTAPLSVTFTDSSTATNAITSWVWEYQRNGAGWVSFSTAEDPSFEFTLGGTYDIRLTVTNADGTDTLERIGYVVVTGGVVADFTGTPLSGAIPFNVVFTDASTGTIAARTWEYRRNNGAWVEFSSIEDPTLAITQSGTYDIRLTVSGSGSDTLIRSAYVVGTGDDTILALYYDEFGPAGQVVASYAFEAETDYYILTSYDSITGLAVLYIDGEIVASESIGSFLLNSADTGVFVGNYGGTGQVDSIIDEVLFLNRAIHPDEVRAVYESDAPVFAETSTWHWRAGRNRLWADASGLWMVNAEGTKVIGAFAGDEDDPAAFYTWGGVNLYSSDVLIGDASRGGYMLWDDSAATMVISGQMVIQEGSTGYENLTGIPASLNDLDSAAWTYLNTIEPGATVGATSEQATKLAGIETGATLGADWGVNLDLMPTWADGRLANIANSSGHLVAPVVPSSAITPPGAGLYLGSDYMGFFDGGVFATYIANTGDFLFRGADSGDYIQWDASENRLQGVGGGVEQWYCDTDNGWLSAGAGAVWMNQYGFNISVDVLDDNRLRFVDAGTEVGAINFVKTLGGIPGPYDGLVFRNFNATGIHFLGTGQTNFYQNVNLDGNDLYGIDVLTVSALDALTAVIAPSSTAVAALDVTAPASVSVPIINVNYSSGRRIAVVESATASVIQFDNADLGNGSVGPYIQIGVNTNATNACSGSIVMLDRAGNPRSLWIDAANNLRTHSSSPTNYSTDTAGVVVGTQSSSLVSKNVLGEFTDYGAALQAILDAPLYDFTYKSGSYNGEQFTGIITDYAPIFGMDNNKSLNEITSHGYTMAAIKALHSEIQTLKAQIEELWTSKKH